MQGFVRDGAAFVLSLGRRRGAEAASRSCNSFLQGLQRTGPDETLDLLRLVSVSQGANNDGLAATGPLVLRVLGQFRIGGRDHPRKRELSGEPQKKGLSAGSETASCCQSNRQKQF